jgi:hypothetical protein
MTEKARMRCAPADDEKFAAQTVSLNDQHHSFEEPPCHEIASHLEPIDHCLAFLYDSWWSKGVIHVRSGIVVE